MRIWIAAISSRPRDTFEELARIYLDRIAPLLPGGAAKSAVETPLFRSEEAFREALDRERARTPPRVVLLDERGTQRDSAAFASWLGREIDEGRQLIVFAIGPADGWSRQNPVTDPTPAKNPGRPDAMRLSLGPMTMAHELARVVLCEQVYRALTILKGHPYHRN